MSKLKDFACEPIASLLLGEGVVGVSRIEIFPSFQGPMMCTLIYRADSVAIDVFDGRAEAMKNAFRAKSTKRLDDMHDFGPLATWAKLRECADLAPTCSTDFVCDGTSYHHAALDWNGGVESRWSNPNWSNHQEACELKDGYEWLMESSGFLLDIGTCVRIRTGIMAGLIGRVATLDPFDGKLELVVDLCGAEAHVELTVNDVEFEPTN